MHPFEIVVHASVSLSVRSDGTSTEKNSPPDNGDRPTHVCISHEHLSSYPNHLIQSPVETRRSVVESA